MGLNPTKHAEFSVDVPPHNLEAERSVLGCCLLEKAALLTVVTRVKAEDFFHPPHRYIYEAVKALFNEDIQPDMVSLTNVLGSTGLLPSAGGPDYIAALTNVVPSVRNAEHYCAIVCEKAQLRRIARLGNEMAAFAGEGKRPVREVLDWSSSRFLELLEKREKKSYTSIKEATAGWHKQYLVEYDDKSLPGIASGYSDLDKLLLGFQPGNLIILAARPSQGKTSLALDFARNISLENHSVAFISLEMSKEELLMRLLCASGPLDSHRIRRKQLSDKKDHNDEDDWHRLNRAIGILGEMDMYIDDTSALTITELRAKVKAISLEKGLDIVVVDYLQLIDGELGSRESRVQEVSKISRNLKALARELKVPIIALSQLSREIERRKTTRRMPQLSDLRESGSIEQDADVVLFIHRELSEEEESEGKQYHPDEIQDTQLIIAKNRNGPVGRVYLEFITRFATFKLSTQPSETYVKL